MDVSKAYMQKNGYNDRISFQDGSAHTFKILKEKEDTIPDATAEGGRKHGMKYLVVEDGVEKEIFTGSIGLISKLAKLELGATVTAQMKKANNKSYYVVTADGQEVLDDDGIPTIGDDDVPPDPSW